MVSVQELNYHTVYRLKFLENKCQVKFSKQYCLQDHNILTCRLKAGILEPALFPRQRTSEARLPRNAQQTVRTLRDND
jgi:hypothetical protein